MSRKNKCRGCVWGTRLNEIQQFCPFGSCVPGRTTTNNSYIKVHNRIFFSNNTIITNERRDKLLGKEIPVT